MPKILTVFGTRPEVIKIAPVINELRNHSNKFLCRVCITGQHREMVDSLLELFDIKPNYDLDIMQKDQSLIHITNAVLSQVGKIITKERPDYLLVQGDTTTAMAASLAAFYQKVKIGHIEAGLRSGNKLHPYPEEVNRKIIDSVSDLYFAHTEWTKQNLLTEGVDKDKIEVTGNTIIDALIKTSQLNYKSKDATLDNIIKDNRKVILLTSHRRENFGQPLQNICQAVKQIASRYPYDILIVYPVHLNPNVQKTVYSILGQTKNVCLIKPLEYLSFIQLMKKAYFILTDSGGLQEEGPSLGKPVLVLRKTTERPEGIAAGTVEIIGTETSDIIKGVVQLLDDEQKYLQMSRSVNPYGNGRASEKIINRLIKDSQNYGD